MSPTIGEPIIDADEYESLPAGSIVAVDGETTGHDVWAKHTNDFWCPGDGRLLDADGMAGVPRRVLRVGWNWGFLEGDREEDELATFTRLARYDWTSIPDDDHRRLHFVRKVAEVVVCYEAKVITGCGLDTAGEIPGLSSRLGLPRCPTCCAAAAIPQGNGSPKNDPECARILGLDPT